MTGWYSGAYRRLGPAEKTNGFPRTGRGAILHSAEGSLDGALRQLAGPAEVSWHFTIALDGRVFQHYPVETQCWHAHAAGNVAFVGIEHENAYTDGTPNHEPFTPAQIASDIALLKWLSEGPYVRRQTLWEHHEVAGNPTTCPNGRVPWDAILAGLAPATIDGLGVAYADGFEESTGWTPAPDHGPVVAVGAHWTDGAESRLYP